MARSQKPKSVYEAFIASSQELFAEAGAAVARTLAAEEPVDRAEAKAEPKPAAPSQIEPEPVVAAPPAENPVQQGAMATPWPQQAPEAPAPELTERQRLVLAYLVGKHSRVSRVLDIADHTGLSFGDVAGDMRTLVKQGLISRPKRHVEGDFDGFSYTVNEPLCTELTNQPG